MFCVECGRETVIFKEGTCKECYLKTHSFSKGPEIVDMPVCTHCDSYKYKNTWTSDLFDEVIKRVIKNVFHINKELTKVNITTECLDDKDGKNCKVIIAGYIDDFEIKEEHKLFVRLKRTVCDVCSRRFGGYHEAVIQIRTDKRKLTSKELNNIQLTVDQLVESIRAKGNRGLFITDVGEEHGGLDFYLSDKGVALTITKHLQEQYGGQIKKSSKNAGMKDSRQIYKMTYLIRLPAYRKNDFILHNNTFYRITSVYRNKVHVISLKDWKEETLGDKDLQKANILGGEELVKEMILVSQTKDEIQIMNPDTYDTKHVRKPEPISFESEKIKVVKIDDQLFIYK
jgi:nonsense-mediated mRNA decay protein 3